MSGSKRIVTPSNWFWRYKFALDDAIFAAASHTRRSFFWLDRETRKAVLPNRKIRGLHKGKRCFILGTSPSIGSQDLSGLANEHTIAVNFFHKHSQAALLRPRYWVIQDDKLWRGGWPQELIGEHGRWPDTMINDITGLSPEVSFFLPAKGRDKPGVREVAERHPVYWLAGSSEIFLGFNGPVDLDGPGVRGNVMQTAITVADWLGFEEIYLLGISLDGLPRDMLGMLSHFYQAQPENVDLEHTTIERDLLSAGYGFRSWRGLADYYSERKLPRVANLTPDGFLDAFPRSTLADVLDGRGPFQNQVK